MWIGLWLGCAGTPVEKVAEGVRAFDEHAITICKGPPAQACREPLGLSPGVLAHGEYHLRAELLVPESGSWEVAYHEECTRFTKGPDGKERSATSNRDQTYAVTYAGPDHGYRLTPLTTMKSPRQAGRLDCRFKLTLPRAAGKKVVSGSWLLPAS